MLLSDNSGLEIENVVNILADVEKEIDTIKLGIDQKKLEFLEVAKEAAEKAKENIMIEVAKSKQKSLEDTKNNIEDEANKILLKSEKSIKDLQKRIDEKFQDALEQISKKIIGE